MNNAERKAMTECSKGHPLTPENTYVYASGVRRCRTCSRIWARTRVRSPRGPRGKRPLDDGIIDEVAVERALKGDREVYDRLTRAEARVVRKRALLMDVHVIERALGFSHGSFVEKKRG